MSINFNPFEINKKMIPAIEAQMAALGLEPTGTRQGDLEAIKEALKTKGKSPRGEFKTLLGKHPSKPPVEFINFLAKLGIKPTGSKEGDYIAVINKLNIMEVQAKTPEEQQEVTSLRESFLRIISSLE